MRNTPAFTLHVLNRHFHLRHFAVALARSYTHTHRYSHHYTTKGAILLIYLFMVRSQDNPATESIAKIDHPSTTTEPEHFRQRCLHC